MRFNSDGNGHPRLLSRLLAGASLALLFLGGIAMAHTPRENDLFPASGHAYQVDFGGDNAFVIAFKSDQEMTFTRLKEPNKGYVETIHFEHKKIRDGVYMVYWQEADKTTVVHVEDFARGIIHTNITSPDGSFFNSSSNLVEVNPASEAASVSAAEPIEQALKTETFNPGSKSLFAVSSVLVTSAKDAVLIDAQFSAADARRLVEMVKASGKHLTTIYISHGDPDFYFGLDTLHTAFPDAKILATPQTVAHIKATQAEKMKVWGPQLGANAPKRIIVPDTLQESQVDLDGEKLQIIGLDGPTPDRSFVWIPSIQTVAGGISVVAGEHVWMADTQTPQSHADWLATLARITSLNPRFVIPSHFESSAPHNMDAVRFTSDYIKTYDAESAKARNSGELVAAMRAHYPSLGGVASLELSAKVSKGEMKWP